MRSCLTFPSPCPQGPGHAHRFRTMPARLCEDRPQATGCVRRANVLVRLWPVVREPAPSTGFRVGSELAEGIRPETRHPPRSQPDSSAPVGMTNQRQPLRLRRRVGSHSTRSLLPPVLRAAGVTPLYRVDELLPDSLDVTHHGSPIRFLRRDH